MSCKEKIVSHSCVSQGSLLSGGYKPYPLSSRGHNGIYARKPKIQFQSFFLINFNSTAPFRMHFWCPIWPGSHSVVTLSDLPYVPHSYGSQGPYPVVATGRTPYNPGTIMDYYAKNPKIVFSKFFLFRSISTARPHSKIIFGARSGQEAIWW